ncbi:hypothetical protein, partial [Altibacter sp.]
MRSLLPCMKSVFPFMLFSVGTPHIKSTFATKLSAFLLLTVMVMASGTAQVFTDGFESGTINNWTAGVGSYSVQAATTTAPAVGSFCLQQTGSSGHYSGLRTTFPSSQPTSVSWRVKSSNVNVPSGYMVFGDNNNFGNGVAFVYFNTGFLQFVSSTTYTYPVAVNTWYHVEL